MVLQILACSRISLRSARSRLRSPTSEFLSHKHPRLCLSLSPLHSRLSSTASATLKMDCSADTPANKDRTKLHGRAFYESIGSPRLVLAPMVDQSEFAWRMLCRSFIPESDRPNLLAYTPMFHARLFQTTPKNRDTFFRPLRNTPIPAYSSDDQVRSPYTSPAPSSDTGAPFLDGNPAIDRPLLVQFCANDADELLQSARLVQPFCDAVDINLGCPQGIARKGRYGSFLQEDWPTIRSMISKLHAELAIPITAKFRILETPERTLEYAQMLLDSGAAWLTLHGRRREQKGHLTGLADWSYIRYLRDHLPPETVIFANGNILEHADLDECLAATGADAVMSAEGCLSNPALFAGPVLSAQDPSFDPRMYWFPRPDDPQLVTGEQDGVEVEGKRDGWRVDAVVRRYLDIIYRYVLETEPPARPDLYFPPRLGLPTPSSSSSSSSLSTSASTSPPFSNAVERTTSSPDTEVLNSDDEARSERPSKRQRVGDAGAATRTPTINASSDSQVDCLKGGGGSCETRAGEPDRSCGSTDNTSPEAAAAASVITDPASPTTDSPRGTAEASTLSDNTKDKNTKKEKNKDKTDQSSKQPKGKPVQDPSLRAMQAHLFSLIPRPMLNRHPVQVRARLAKCRAGDMDAYEDFSRAVDAVVEAGMRAYEGGKVDVFGDDVVDAADVVDAVDAVNAADAVEPVEPVRPDCMDASVVEKGDGNDGQDGMTMTTAQAQTQKQEQERTQTEPAESSAGARLRCRRAWWICQPYIRPLPAEALITGALTAKK